MRNCIRALGVVCLVVGFTHVVSTQGTQPAAKPAAKGQAAKPAPAMAAHVLVQEENIKWGPPPAGFPAGAQFAVLDGDPSKAGALYAVAIKMPDGYTVMPHWHPADEHVEVIAGTFKAGMGDTVDEGKMLSFSPGSYAKMPHNVHHYAMASGATEIHVFGPGPFAITYVHPNDDPRKKSTH